MVDRREQVCFALQASKIVGLVSEPRRKNFNGYVAAELGVTRTINLAHAARADLGEQFVVRDRAWGPRGAHASAED
jgi:hypothetical protein